MSISYEEALATLEAMFAEPWTRETLDLVLRHEKGHMENTCDRILSYGSHNDPQILIQQLQSGQIADQQQQQSSSSQQQQSIDMDEELARQLAAQLQGGGSGGSESRGSGGGGAGGGAGASATPTPPPPPAGTKGRGTPTDLPKEFLRIPGYPHRSVLVEKAAAANGTNRSANTAATGVGGTDLDDETLARMLQDEFFSQELARNPEFAHLAGSGGGGGRVPPGNRRHPTASSASLGSGRLMTRQQQYNRQQQPQGPNIMDKLSGTLFSL